MHSSFLRSSGCKHKQDRFVQFFLSGQRRARECRCIFWQSQSEHFARKEHCSARAFGCKNLHLVFLQRSAWLHRAFRLKG